MNREEYVEFLRENNFNQKQIDLITSVRTNFESFEKDNEENEDYSIALDGWERDQWYTFNRSGLFEDNDEENLSDITCWSQIETRMYVTEIEIQDTRTSNYPI